MLIVGEKEVDGKVVTVRRRFVKEQETLSLDKFSNGIRKALARIEVSIKNYLLLFIFVNSQG